ncbi:helix-turn-helix domain-containing protein [Enterovirga sp. CN4-39]|uniref:helix-turn-helix domain-containing protein n=1 Tax=Enterovirga sp. CN4-39 TaxID=3400910 RepID=UPI003C10B1A9
MGTLTLSEKADLTQALLRDAQLKPSSRAVGIALLGFMNGQSGECFPSYSTLAGAASLKRRATINAVRDLEGRGWITVHRVTGGDPSQLKGWVTNRFLVHAPAHSDATPDTSPPVHVDAPGPGAQPCTTPVHDGALPPVHGDAPPPVHGGAPKLMNNKPMNMNSGDISLAASKTRAKKSGPSEAEIGVAFDEWWPHYPKKVDRDGARRALGRVLKAGRASLPDLIAGADQYAQLCAARKTERRFIKSPEVWLNKGCWADEPDPQPTSSSPNGKEAIHAWSQLDFGSPTRRREGGLIIEAEYQRVD